MNSQNHLNSIQNILNNIADLANELPEYELTIDKIEFNNLESFEQNLKTILLHCLKNIPIIQKIGSLVITNYTFLIGNFI